jgi:DNA mismatch endonuclease Vsr
MSGQRVAAVSEARRRNMAAIKGKDTQPELLVRALIRYLGYGYRLHQRDLPGRPDIVFRGRRKVLEVRGCFWHRHADPSCKNAVLPRSEWWRRKLEQNVERDKRNSFALQAAGWSLLVVWECELANLAYVTRKLSHFLQVGCSSGTSSEVP